MTALASREYPLYKDTGIEWLEIIPDHWKLSRIKELTETKSGTTPRSDNSDYYDDGTHYWIRTTDLNNDRLYDAEFKVTDLAVVHHGLATIPINSVLLAMYGGMGTIGKNALLQAEAVINQSVCAILPNKRAFNAVYLWYFFQYFRPNWELFANSSRKDPNISQEVIKRLWIPLPPLPEQQAIAAYLDAKTAQIDRKIDLLTQKAAKYRQLRQSLINAAVTRGLDKSVAMKDSGVAWIGEIPAHWELKRVTDIVTKIGNGVTPLGGSAVYTDAGIPFLRSQNVYDDGLLLGDVSFIPLSIHKEMKGSQLKPYDILFNITGASISRTCVVPPDLPPANINQHVAFLRVVRGVDTSFVALFLKSSLIKSYVRFEQNGASKEAFTLKQIADIPLVLPTLGEQRTIVEYLEFQMAKIDHIVETVDTQVEKLKELRKALINDVVTGKLRVT